MNTHRSGVLALYRATLKQAKLLPIKERSARVCEIREGYKNNINAEEESWKELVRDGFGKLGYLRTVTPRLDRRAKQQQERIRSYKIRDGNTIEGISAPRRQGQLVQNDEKSAWSDVQLKGRLKHHIDKDHFLTPEWDESLRNGTYVPLMSRSVEGLMDESIRLAKGVNETPDELKQARNSVGSKTGVKRERMRYSHAPWDVTWKGGI